MPKSKKIELPVEKPSDRPIVAVVEWPRFGWGRVPVVRFPFPEED